VVIACVGIASTERNSVSAYEADAGHLACARATTGPGIVGALNEPGKNQRIALHQASCKELCCLRALAVGVLHAREIQVRLSTQEMSKPMPKKARH
jgi:hypothetical protein